MQSVTQHQQTSVLIVGGGLVGLTFALALRKQGTPFILVEREPESSPLPRARGWAVRSMEIFRSLGLQSEIEEAARKAWQQGVFGGGRRGHDMLSSRELVIPDTKVLTGDDPSPCKMVACPQTAVEPILREALEARGGDVRFGCEVMQLEQDEQGIHVMTKEARGAECKIDAQYLVAADGSRGNMRRWLNIDRHGSGEARHYVNIFFEADLAAKVKGRTFSQCEVTNDKVSGFFLSMNNTNLWSFHLLYDPEKDEPNTWGIEKIEDMLHAAVGDQTPLQIRHSGTWVAVDRVADHFRSGRVFLIGDTAHIMPPWGGLNGNTGIADAHNLAWKLAHVVRGEATPNLLDSYEGDRQPVARRNGEQAQLRTDFDLRFGIRTPANTNDFDRLRDGGELLMRYRYGASDTVDSLRTQIGTRFPHAWISNEQGERISTLDLFGTSITTLRGPVAPDGPGWRIGKDLSFLEAGVSWMKLTGLGEDAVVQVRPDGFVVSVKEAAAPTT